MPAFYDDEKMASQDESKWHSLQCFGVRTPAEQVRSPGHPTVGCDSDGVKVDDADIISTMDFDVSGDFLATGDKGGRVVVFERMPFRENLPSPISDSPPASLSTKMKHRQQPSYEFRSYVTSRPNV